ncbi:MAG: tRNA lysidine(34) synthetase TilS [Nitrospirota bacterium]
MRQTTIANQAARIEKQIAGAVISFARRYRCLSPGERIVVAVSGGPDSTALLHVLHRLCPARNLALHVAHVHHGLRGAEADEDAAFVQKTASDLGLPHETICVDVRTRAQQDRSSLAVAARAARYEAIEAVRVRCGASCVATAHTMDDQAETVLMRLIRGTGPAGLAGIPSRRGTIVRPLLSVRRASLAVYLGARGISFRIDSSNADLRQARNRIRGELLPLLCSYNPRIVPALARLADMAREEETAFDEVLSLFDPAGAETAVRLLRERPPEAVLRRLVSQQVARETRRFVSPGAGEVGRLTSLLVRGKPGDRTPLAAGDWGVRGYDGLLIRSARGGPVRPLPETALAVPGETAVPALGIRIKAETERRETERGGRTRLAVLDADRIEGSLVVRTRRPGDRISPLGMKGTKKLQDVLVDAKVPRDERDRVPIVADARGIVWVVGLRLDRRAAAVPETRRLLALTVTSPG